MIFLTNIIPSIKKLINFKAATTKIYPHIP